MKYDTDKMFAMIVIGALAFIQAGAWYMGFNGQSTVIITGAITYLMGIVTRPTIEKVITPVIKKVAK